MRTRRLTMRDYREGYTDVPTPEYAEEWTEVDTTSADGVLAGCAWADKYPRGALFNCCGHWIDRMIGDDEDMGILDVLTHQYNMGVDKVILRVKYQTNKREG